MANALDTFRAQRKAADRVHARLVEITGVVLSLETRVQRLVQNDALRELLRDEERWLTQAEQTLAELRRLRDAELARFWPGVWRRWFVAVAFALASAAAFGSGHAWASRPYDAELASLRSRVEILDFVGQRVIAMTPAERRQFDALMRGGSAPRR
jgi:hypothetical protein